MLKKIIILISLTHNGCHNIKKRRKLLNKKIKTLYFTAINNYKRT